MSEPYLVIHGAGMQMRGKSQIETFGPMTLAEYDRHINQYATELGTAVEIFSSNTEGQVIERLYRGHDEGCPGAIINPAGFTVGYPALCAAMTQVKFPIYELHISNPAARGRISDIATGATGVITGFGVQGYSLALQGLLALSQSR